MKKIFYGIVLALTAILLIPNTVSAAPTTTKESTEWSKVVTNFKNNIKPLESQSTITITDDAYSMKVTIKTKENVEATVTYGQSYGIVRYDVETPTTSAKVAMLEYMIHYNLFKAVAQNYNYDVDNFIKWLETTDENKLTVDNDGIEYKWAPIIKETNSSVQSGASTTESISGKTFKSFAINIDCGIQSYKPVETPDEDPVVPPTEEPTEPPKEEPKEEEPVEQPEEQPVVEPEPEENVEEPVENPDTGLYISLGLVAAIVIGVAGFMVSKKKTYFNKI